MKREQIRAHRVEELCEGFERFIAVFDSKPPFQRENQLRLHRQTIRLRRELGTIASAVSSGPFLESLRETLKAWGIGVRASHLVEPQEFAAALDRVQPQLAALETISLADASPDVGTALWNLIGSLDITDNQARLVATTKTLHHLLPDLVPPIDREYTGRFFRWHAPEFQAEQERIFRTIWDGFTTIARRTRPERLVTNKGWRTSATKLIDNAIVGWCLAEAPEASEATDRGRERMKPEGLTALRHHLRDYETELRSSGLKENTVRTYVDRADAFLRWLAGEYTPRGPDAD